MTARDLARDLITAQRAVEVLGLLCTESPPLELVLQWVTGQSEDLQEWALNHSHGRLSWATGIALVEAALAIAHEPARHD